MTTQRPNVYGIQSNSSEIKMNSNTGSYQEKYQINYLTLDLKRLEKEVLKELKVSGRK